MKPLFVIFILVLTAFSAHAVSAYDLVTKSCRFYPGFPLQTYMSPETGGLQNPLIASPLGRLAYFPTFKKSIVQFDYLSSDQVVKAITDSPDLDRALTHCYGANQEAKVNFLFFMNSLPVQAKADAFVLTAASFVFAEGILAQVAARLPFIAALARAGTAMKVVAGLVLAEASYVTLKTLVRYIQFKRHKLHDHEVQEMMLVNQQQKRQANEQIAVERKSIDDLQAFALRDLETNIATLKTKAQTIQDPARRAQLQTLITKSEQTLNELKAS